MRKASLSAIAPPNSWITAAQQAGNAPMCSGSTTCCATTSPLSFISAQLASWDSRTIVEKPVRNSEFCISCTMPERLAFTTSRSTASMCILLSSEPASGGFRPTCIPSDRYTWGEKLMAPTFGDRYRIAECIDCVHVILQRHWGIHGWCYRLLTGHGLLFFFPLRFFECFQNFGNMNAAHPRSRLFV